MLKGSTARHYAQAVFQIGVEQGTVDRWRDDLNTLAEYFRNRQLLFVLREPKIPAIRKNQMVSDLVGGKVQQDALNLAELLVERGLADLVPLVGAQFESLYNDYRGQAVAQVTTAIPLDDDLRGQISRQLQQITGKRIILQERVDPAILGGAIARVGDMLIDGSLKRRFKLLREQIVAGVPLGGMDDAALAAFRGIPGPDGAAATVPFVVATEADTSNGPAQGPQSSTEMARRAPDAPHLGPHAGATSTTRTPGNDRRAGRGNNSSNKRRRR